VNAPDLAVVASYLASFVAGLVLGLVFFGGLWLTVKQLERTANPGLLFTVSFAVRAVAVCVGIVLVGAGQWQRYALCLAGFIVMRMILTRRWGTEPEAGHR